MERDRHFMSVAGRAIWYTRLNNGDVWYMVAKGDGTDEYFADWQEAMKYCYEHPRKNMIKEKGGNHDDSQRTRNELD